MHNPYHYLKILQPTPTDGTRTFSNLGFLFSFFFFCYLFYDILWNCFPRTYEPNDKSKLFFADFLQVFIEKKNERKIRITVKYFCSCSSYIHPLIQLFTHSIIYFKISIRLCDTV